MSKIVQCVPNFSEGRDSKKIEAIVSVLKNKEGFEEISSGHMLQSAWENIQSIYKVRADSTEFGANAIDVSRKDQLYAEIKRRRNACKNA